MEEENFAKTIDGGMRIFDDMLAEHKAKGETVFSGADAFKLYDTYGFPIDLTMEMVEDEGMTVDQAAFEKLMEEQRVRARRGPGGAGGPGLGRHRSGPGQHPPPSFVGYDCINCEAQSRSWPSWREGRGRARWPFPAARPAFWCWTRLPSMPKWAARWPTTGVIMLGASRFEVTNVQKNKGGKYLHYGKV